MPKQQGEKPKKPSEWVARPIDPSNVPLSKVAGAAPEDEGNGTVTLHFVYSSDLSGVVLHRASLGPIGRDKRWGKHVIEPLEESDFPRFGLEQPSHEIKLAAAEKPKAEPPQADDEEEEEK